MRQIVHAADRFASNVRQRLSGVDASLDQRVNLPRRHEPIALRRATQTPPVSNHTGRGRNETIESVVTFLFLNFDGETLKSTEERAVRRVTQCGFTLPMIPAGRHQKATPTKQIVVVIILPMNVDGDRSPKPIVVICNLKNVARTKRDAEVSP